jgi:hypothetical protein
MDRIIMILILGLSIIAQGAFLFYWGKSGAGWGNIEDECGDKGDC